jgi:hypothetical protein
VQVYGSAVYDESVYDGSAYEEGGASSSAVYAEAGDAQGASAVYDATGPSSSAAGGGRITRTGRKASTYDGFEGGEDSDSDELDC